MDMMRLSILGTLKSVALALLAGPLAAAEASCLFTQECFEGEPCGETAYEVTVSGEDGGVLVLESIAETIEGTGGIGNGVLYVTAFSETAAHLLTAVQGGDARYTLHMEGPLVITYQGMCEMVDQ